MPEQSEPLLDAALDYLRAGLCVLPANLKEKRPAVPSWKPYQKQLPKEDELRHWFAGGAEALCIITGAISGSLELIDFDMAGHAYEPWARLVEGRCPGLLEHLVRERSQSSGVHVCYRYDEPVPGNTKLASRLIERPDARPVMLAAKEYVPRLVGGRYVVEPALIETRGQGGLFLCAPSPGYVLKHGSFEDLPVLTMQERAVLIECARALNEVPDHPQPDTAHPSTSFDGGRPGDEYNARGDVREVLKAHGWTLVQAGENERWRRPGKDEGSSATFNGKVFYCFTSNAPPFEMNRGYSPFAVYAQLKHGGDFAAAASALAQQGYGAATEDTEGVDLSVMLGPLAEDDGRECEDPGLLPESLLRVPGLIAEVMDYTLDTAPYPNPVLAFAGALGLQGFLAGRKVRDSANNRTNLYLLALANSGTGKDHPRKVNQRILLEVGLQDCIGDAFASGEGIEDRLYAQPSMLFQTDEIDAVIVAMKEGKEQRYEGIMQMLLKMYTSSDGLYPMRVKAGKEHKVIDQPSLCLLGTAIPTHYYEALSAKMLTNGFFARMLILEAGPRGDGQEPVCRDLPDSIVETARWWSNFRPGKGNLENWHPIPRAVDYTPVARELLAAFRRDTDLEYTNAEADQDTVAMTIWARAGQKARRLALIYACSQDHENSTVSEDAIRWAADFVRHQTRRMLFMAYGHVAENPFHADCLKIIEKLRNAPDRELDHSTLLKRMKMDAQSFHKLIDTLLQRGDIGVRQEPTAGRTATHYHLAPGATKGRTGVNNRRKRKSRSLLLDWAVKDRNEDE